MPSQADTSGSRRKVEYLYIGIHANKTHATHARVNHTIDGVHTAAANARDNNIHVVWRLVVKVIGIGGSKGIIFCIALIPVRPLSPVVLIIPHHMLILHLVPKNGPLIFLFWLRIRRIGCHPFSRIVGIVAFVCILMKLWLHMIPCSSRSAHTIRACSALLLRASIAHSWMASYPHCNNNVKYIPTRLPESR